jgi:hypothetical protein
VLFDEAIFQEPGIDFCINNGKSNLPDLTHQDPRFCIQALSVGSKIGANAIFEIFGFANINQFICFIPKLIYARFLG